MDSGVTYRRRRRRTASDKENNQQENAPMSKTGGVHSFVEAAQKTSQASYWRDKHSLVDIVVEASQNKCSSSPSLLLAEHASSIVSSCRALTKEAVASKDDDNAALDALYVVTTALRAVVLAAGCIKRDTVVRLLYHVTVTAVEALDQNNPVRAATICLAAYEALSSALAGTTTSIQYFPLPDFKVAATIPAEQVCSMGVFSTLGVARVVAQLVAKGTSTAAATDLLLDDFGTLALSSEIEFSGIDVVRHLVCEIAMPWIASIVNDAKNVTSNCKKAHRILWDLSAHGDCLQLQKDAIRALLLDGYENARKLVKSNFENACTYAWKAAESSFRSSKSKMANDSLRCFHDEIGTLLDSFASIGDCPKSYTEYCAYRALHVGPASASQSSGTCSKNCLFRHLAYDYVHDCRDSSANDYVFLALFFLSLELRRFLEGLQTRDMDDNSSSLVENSSAIVSHFRAIIIEGKLDSATRLSYYRLLSLLKLHRLVFQVLESDLEEIAESLPLDHLHLATEVLSQCMGPLCFGLVADKSFKKDQVVSQMWAVGAECLKQAISASEIVYRASRDESTLEASNGIAEELVKFLSSTPVKPPTDCIENAAKFLGIIGKRRYESGDTSLYAITPLLFSAKLLMHVSVSLPPESIRQLKISSRLAFLSSMYKSLDLVDESIVTMVSALLYEAVEVSLAPLNGNKNDISVTLLVFLTSLTRDVISTGSIGVMTSSNQRMGLIGGLVQLLSQRDQSDHGRVDSGAKPSVLSPERTIDMLLGSSQTNSTAAECFESCCGVSFSLRGILQVMLTKNAVPRYKQINRDVLSAEKTRLMAELIVRQAKILQQDGCGKPDDPAVSVGDYNFMCRLAESYVRQIDVGTSRPNQVIMTMLHVVASVSLLSYYPSIEFENWSIETCFQKSAGEPKPQMTLADKYARKAIDALEEISEVTSDWDLTASAFRSALDLYRFQLSCLRYRGNGKHSIDLKRLQATVEHLRDASPSTSCLMTLSKHCVIRGLARLRGLFSLEGEDLYAVQTAKWNVDAATQSGRNPHPWFEATVLSLLATNSLILAEESKHSGNITATEPADIEALACRLRLLVNCSENEEVDTIRDQFGCLLDVVEGILASECSNKETAYLLRWSRTTALLGISECTDRRSELGMALDALKLCFQDCKKILSSLEKDKVVMPAREECPFWEHVAVASMPIRCIERQADCLQRTALLYNRLGDYKKSLEYSRLALQTAGLETDFVAKKSTFADLIDFVSSSPCQSSQEMRLRRLYLRLKAQASPLDIVTSAAITCADNRMLSAVKFLKYREQLTVNIELEKIRDLCELYDMLQGYSFSPLSENFALHFTAKRRLSKFVELPDVSQLLHTVSSLRDQQKRLLPRLQYDVQLRDAACTLGFSHVDEGPSTCSEKEAMESLKLLAASSNYPNQSRAWSNYLLGSAALNSARKNGDLKELWDAGSSEDRLESPFLIDARVHFTKSLKLLCSACDMLKRNAQRCLALVTGPQKSDNCDGMTAFSLINASVGGAASRQIFKALAALNQNDPNFRENASTKWLFDQLRNRASPEWRFVTAALCPTGELLLTSVEYSDAVADMIERTICVFPSDLDVDGCSSSGLFEEIIKPLNGIVQRSQEQLAEAANVAGIDDKDSKEEHKRHWWENRNAVDSELHQLIERVEEKLLFSDDARQVLIGQPCVGDSFEISGSNLASKFEAACGLDDGSLSSASTTSDDPPESLKLSELRDELLGYGIDAQVLRKMKKPELVKLVEQERNRDAETTDFEKVNESMLHHASEKESEGACTFLILDENLQRFPFESLPCFAEKAICRLPSLWFALAKLIEVNHDGSAALSFHPESVAYVLDPESNLGGTKERLRPFMRDLDERHGGNWRGVVGVVPPADFIQKELCMEDGCLLYFGHGGGQQYIARKDIEAMVHPKEESTIDHLPRAKSSAILMGCSSGKLESVNTKGSNSAAQLPIHFEPEGIAVLYLLAGAPCVVGNLWDVTDHDIDRFSMALVTRVFDGSGDQSIAQSVAEARSACKMRYIVGSAPVCYGLPVTPKYQSKR